MTLVHILGDGSSLPKLSYDWPIIMLTEGEVFFGNFNAEKFRRNEFYIDAPDNYDELNEEIQQYVKQNCGIFKFKKHPVYLLCPKYISKKMKWLLRDEQQNYK